MTGLQSEQARKRLGQLSVELSVRVCDRSLKLNELLSWHAGTVLTFDHDVTSPLQLRLGGKSIAIGRPVKIDEKFGLEIQRFDN